MTDNHKVPANWDECCSCCPVLEKENKELKVKVEKLVLLYMKTSDSIKKVLGEFSPTI